MTLSLPPLLAWLAATVLPLGAAWLLFRVALRPERCFGYNRILLLLAPLVAAGLPLLPRPALPAWPTWQVAARSAGAAEVGVLLPTLDASGGVGADGWPGWPWLAALYGAGVALGLGRLAWQLWQLRQAARGLPREERAGYGLRYTGGRLPTSSFGHTIFWDETASLTAAEAASVLAHERAHGRQGHTYDVLWLEVWRALLWPNPFSHLLLPALRLTHELLADREAATAAAAPTPSVLANSYTALLAQVTARSVGRSAYLSLLQPFTFSFTLTRIAMLQNQTPVRRWKQWLTLPVLGGLFLVACQPESAQIAPSKASDTVQAMPGKDATDAEREAWRKVTMKKLLYDDSLATGGKIPAGKKRMFWQREDGKTWITYEDKNFLKELPNQRPGVYVYVEQMPELPGGGGYAAIVEAIQKEIVYPKGEIGIAPAEGRVFVSFIVGVDGLVSEPQVVKTIGPAYTEAVLAAVRRLPRFNPGRQNGRAVEVRFTVPVQFGQSKPGSEVAPPPPPKLRRQ